jgi:hypothetical protein
VKKAAQSGYRNFSRKERNKANSHGLISFTNFRLRAVLKTNLYSLPSEEKKSTRKINCEIG